MADINERSELTVAGHTLDHPIGAADSDRAIDDLRQELGIILEQLATELVADAVTLFLYDNVTDEFDLPVGYGLYDPASFADPRLRPHAYERAGKIVREKRPIIADQVAEHPDMDGPFARRERIVSAAGVPLIHAHKSLGILFVNYRRVHIFDATDQQIITASALRAAIAIAKADVFTALRERRSRPSSPLQAILRLARNVVRMPVAIWLLDSRRHNLHIEAASGLTHKYLTDASASPDDASVIG